VSPPTDEAAVYRLRTEATTWINATALQAGRLARRYNNGHLTNDLDFEVLAAGLHLFVIALARLRRCIARAGEQVEGLRGDVSAATELFDANVPWLRKVRNVAEHLDEYNLDLGRDKGVVRMQVQNWHLDGNDSGGVVWGWLGERIDVDEGDRAGLELYRTFESTSGSWLKLRHEGSSL
jgi:hypothetical protein